MIWFAWYPVRIETTGRWVWLRKVWAQREVRPGDSVYHPTVWVYYLEGPGLERHDE